MRQILCLLLVLLIGGKDGAHSLPLEVKPLTDQLAGQIREVPDESLDPASFPEGFTPKEIGRSLAGILYRENIFCTVESGYIMPKFAPGWGL